MNETVAGWLRELEAVNTEAEALVAPLTAEQFTWRPGPNRWSVGECFEHLAITTGLVAPNLLAALDRARIAGKAGHPPFAYGLIGGWFVRTMEKPGRRPMPSPENFIPPSGGTKGEVMDRFRRSQHEFKEALESAPGLALDRIKAPSTAKGAGWLRLNVAAWFASTLAHERRHVAQARRVVESAGFPPRVSRPG